MFTLNLAPALFPDRTEVLMSGGFGELRKKVLVVDDYDDLRAVTKRALEGCGYTVFEAENGEEAISLAQSALPDLILMDLSMPNLDGFTAIHRIRRLLGLGDVPIIAVSAHAAKEVREDALAAGCREFLLKPVSHERLTQAVARYLRPQGQDD
jgi:CheY-like chemotaxis protein